MGEAIFVEGLTKTYAGKTVVDHLELSAKSGTAFGLLGANGAGKAPRLNVCSAQNSQIAEPCVCLEKAQRKTPHAVSADGC